MIEYIILEQNTSVFFLINWNTSFTVILLFIERYVTNAAEKVITVVQRFKVCICC